MIELLDINFYIFDDLDNDFDNKLIEYYIF